MNTKEIDRFLRRRLQNFDGVFSIDTLPDRPRLLVCNTDPSDKRGRHWVCVYVENGRREFFDWFGRRPNETFECYLNRHCSSWSFNERQLQSVISKLCGHYCIYCCICRSRNTELRRKIVRSFTNDTALNDVLIHGFVCNYRR